MEHENTNMLLEGRPTIFVVNWTEIDDYGQMQRQEAFSNKDAAWEFMTSLPEQSYASIVALKLWDINPNTLIKSMV